MFMFGRIFLRLLICCLLLSSPAAAAGQDTNRPGSSTTATSSAQSNPEAEAKIGQLERTLFWLGIVCAIGLMLPLPLCLYHFRRIGALLVEIERLQTELRDQEALKAQLDSLLARNNKLETEIKQLQENYRSKLLSAQDKHQETIEKLKRDLRALEGENKRLSGLILLKEQASKKL